MTLSLCLFIRYYIKKEVDLPSRGWLLSLSAMAAYKLSYDNEVVGLLDCFAEDVLRVPKKDLVDL